MNIPVEFNIGGVYMPPLLVASVLGVITAMIIAKLLNKYRLSKYFFYPPLVVVALVVIFAVFYGAIIIPF